MNITMQMRNWVDHIHMPSHGFRREDFTNKKFWAIMGLIALVGLITLTFILAAKSGTTIDETEFYPFYPLP